MKQEKLLRTAREALRRAAGLDIARPHKEFAARTGHPMSHQRLLTTAGLLALALLALLASLWVRLPLEFSRPCRLLPQAEWVLLRTAPDTFEALLIERDAGERQSFEVFRFERGDVVRFSIADSIHPGTRVTAGTEVGSLRSYTSRTAQQALVLELREAEATLRAAETGEKSEIVAQARGEVAEAEALRALHEVQAARAVRLHEAGLLSAAERETAESLVRQSEGVLSSARGALRAAEVGEKESLLAAYRAHVELLRGQLAEAERRLEAERLLSPITGEVMAMQADSALVRIADTDTLYAFAPVPPSRVLHLRKGDPAQIRAFGSGARASGSVVALDSEASTYAGRTFFWATVRVPNPRGTISSGLSGSLHFTGERVTLLAWVIDRIRHASDRTLGV